MGTGEADDVVSGRSRDRQRAVLMSATGQLRGRLRAVSRGRRQLCAAVGIRQSMGRVGSCFDNAAAESFFSSLEWEVLSRNVFDTRRQAHDSVVDWAYTFYNHHRRHTAANGLPPAEFEARTQPTNRPDAA